MSGPREEGQKPQSTGLQGVAEARHSRSRAKCPSSWEVHPVMRTDEATQLREQITELRVNAEQILTRAKAEQRDMTGEEARRFDSILAEAKLKRDTLNDATVERRRSSVYKTTLGESDEH